MTEESDELKSAAGSLKDELRRSIEVQKELLRARGILRVHQWVKPKPGKIRVGKIRVGKIRVTEAEDMGKIRATKTRSVCLDFKDIEWQVRQHLQTSHTDTGKVSLLLIATIEAEK